MGQGSYRFERFLLDTSDRRLLRDGAPVEINARYFDALALLVREQGRLVNKDRFMDEVWRGIPVTDEALTQCIRTLRRLLGDDAASPRFIETVPKHGYRFIAALEEDASAPVPPRPVAHTAEPSPWQRLAVLGGAGTIGGGMAGLLGGLAYGLGASSQPLQPGPGATSILLVLVALTVLVGIVGGAGVSFGIAAANFRRSQPSAWSVAGGAVGGLLVGALAKLLGLDAFALLVGRSPGDITGAPEGFILGAAAGLGLSLAARTGVPRLRSGMLMAAALGAVAGAIIVAAGGRLMAGSLDLLARAFPASGLRVAELGWLLGERGFGPVTHLLTAALEGALFVSFVVGATLLAERHWRGSVAERA